MEGVGAAASVIAVIQLTQEVYKLCQSYVLSVKNARRDIDLLCKEVMDLHDVLETLDNWLQGTDASESLILSKLKESSGGPLDLCQKELKSIKEILETYTSPTGAGGQQMMKRVGMRALKWPFSERDLKAKINTLQKGKDSLNLALTAENTYVNELSTDTD